jgi:hypothetical protein
MGEAGREHVKALYEWSDCVAAMEKALLETTAMRRSAGG